MPTGLVLGEPSSEGVAHRLLREHGGSTTGPARLALAGPPPCPGPPLLSALPTERGGNELSMSDPSTWPAGWWPVVRGTPGPGKWEKGRGGEGEGVGMPNSLSWTEQPNPCSHASYSSIVLRRAVLGQSLM